MLARKNAKQKPADAFTSDDTDRLLRKLASADLADKPKNAKQKRTDAFTSDDIDRILRKLSENELADLVNELTVDPAEPDKGRLRNTRIKSPDPFRLVILSTGRKTRYWFSTNGQISLSRPGKKTLAIGGVLASMLGLAYQYVQVHSDQIIALVRMLLHLN